MASRQGQLILAAPSLQDPNFRHTVTLLVQHGDDGALGLVLNHPTDVTVEAALAASDAPHTPCRHTGLVHRGGPCSGPLMLLHTSAEHAGIAVAPGLFFTVDADDVAWLLEHHHGPMRCFVGYAGWGAGQIEAEIHDGAWLLAHATAHEAFAPGDGQWLRLLRMISPAQAALAANPRLRPADPTLN